MAEVIKFEDYDVFGFDIDNTLAKYNIPELFELVNESVVSFLTKNGTWKAKGPAKFQQDFCCRGIVFERKKGNFLKLAEDGFILRASHGTRFMKDEEIVEVYGKDRHWPYFEEIIKNVNNVGDNRIFENFFDMPLVNSLAAMVDQADEQGIESDAWEAIFPGAEDTYAQKHFSEEGGGFFPAWKKDTARYVEPCSASVKAWLKKLKAAGKTLFLMSSSYVDYATASMRHILGADWQEYFDISITDAKKPGFFYKGKPFLATEECLRATDPVEDIKEGGIYSQGNLETFNAFLSKHTGKTQPKVIYFGDSLRSDVFPGKSYANWECVLVLEEMLAEQWQGNQLLHKVTAPRTSPKDKAKKGDDIAGDLGDDVVAAKKQKSWGPSQLEKEYLTSVQWGSFFTDSHKPCPESRRRPLMNTLWGYMIRKYADLAIPQLEYIADFPFDQEFIVFNHEETHQWGFYPNIPLALQPDQQTIEPQQPDETTTGEQQQK